jgi:predicted nucleic acid-binding Zn ribbon protein
MITNGEGTMNWKCERCYTEFEVSQNVMNSLMISATHCATCTKTLSAAFSATVGA